LLRANPLSCAGLAALAGMGRLALFAPGLSTYAPMDSFAPLEAPSAAHILGTNDLGYDLWTELLQGARYSLALGLSAAVTATAVGLFVGTVAGYADRLGFVLLRLIDVLLSVPRFPLVILVAAFTQPGFGTLWLFFSFFGWPPVARVICSRIRAERSSEYVTAAYAIGARRSHVLWRHLFPRPSPGLCRLVGEMQHVIMAESGLSFLGLGDPTMRSWGMTLAHAFRYRAPLLTDVWQWWVLPPGLAITIVCLALVFIGFPWTRWPIPPPSLTAAGHPVDLEVHA
jgi:ABC-type dipeptide/oligopeptide/nickel transport system permease subunit